MASPATSSHLPALAEPHEREAIAHELQSTMHELVDLSLIGKQLHWAVVGHAFRPVHEQLDELVASWRDLADVVAERAVALGYVPDGQARAVAAGSPLSPVAAEATESHALIRAITDRVAQVSETARERMDRIAERDAVSQHVLIDVVRTLEHQQWMLRAQLSDRA
jgi:starvation-inducible DNA-binding protein